MCERNCNIIAPFIPAAGNKNECKLLRPALESLKNIARKLGLRIKGAILSLDGIYDSKSNRKMQLVAG